MMYPSRCSISTITDYQPITSGLTNLPSTLSSKRYLDLQSPKLAVQNVQPCVSAWPNHLKAVFRALLPRSLQPNLRYLVYPNHLLRHILSLRPKHRITFETSRDMANGYMHFPPTPDTQMLSANSIRPFILGLTTDSHSANCSLLLCCC